MILLFLVIKKQLFISLNFIIKVKTNILGINYNYFEEIAVWMFVFKVLDYINTIAPFSTAQDFDNVGLLIGDLHSDFNRCIVCLDVTRNVFKQAVEEKANLIISHHPVIFNGLKAILKKDLLYDILKTKISIISAHTNLDVAQFGVSFNLAQAIELLDVQILEESMNFGRIGNLKKELECDEFIKHVSKKLKTTVKAVKSSKKIKRVAVVSGSGYFALKAAIKKGADALVTGESKHDILVEAFEKNFCFVDASHFATEVVITLPLVDILNKKFKDDEVVFFAAKEQNPCCYAFGEKIWG